MSYDTDKYQTWRTKAVPYKLALALADDQAPSVGEASVPMAAMVVDLAEDADLPTTVAKVNEIIAALKNAGLMGTL